MHSMHRSCHTTAANQKTLAMCTKSSQLKTNISLLDELCTRVNKNVTFSLKKGKKVFRHREKEQEELAVILNVILHIHLLTKMYVVYKEVK